MEEHPPAPCNVSAVDGDALWLAGGRSGQTAAAATANVAAAEKSDATDTQDTNIPNFSLFFFSLFLLPEAPVQVKPFFPTLVRNLATVLHSNEIQRQETVVYSPLPL